jgi:membrane-associated PAP2 superfamily phosphatase
MIAAALRAARAFAAPRPTAGLAVLVCLALLLAWDASGLDLPLAQAVGSGHGFAWRDAWLLTDVLHDGGRQLSWAFALALCLGVWWPVGPLARLPVSRRLQLAVSTLAAAFVVSLLKGLNATSCPWDLSLFGGVAQYVSHWSRLADGGPGHCFPAGHAASGFAFLGGWFAFRRQDTRVAWLWLLAAWGTGWVFGISQQLRGAHFMSHTLWTAWICWTTAWVLDGLHRLFALREL